MTKKKLLFPVISLAVALVLCGWKEEKIVIVFALVSAVMCVVAWFGIC